MRAPHFGHGQPDPDTHFGRSTMSIAEHMVPLVLLAIIAMLVVALFWPRGHGYRPYHGTYLDGDDN